MRYGRLPAPGGFRRKVVVGLLVLALLPVLPAIALTASTAFVDAIGNILGVVWPWVAAIVMLVIVGRLVIGRFRR
jgi:hypothetical protein